MTSPEPASLILDPQLGGDSPEEDVDLLVNGVTWNLWPKLIADQSGHSRMNVSILLNGKPASLPDIQQHPVLSGYEQCLLGVRAAESKVALQRASRHAIRWNGRRSGACSLGPSSDTWLLPAIQRHHEWSPRRTRSP